MQSSNIEYLEKINNLMRLSNKGQDHFPDILCDELIREFNLQAMVIFQEDTEKDLIVIGRSTGAKRTFIKGNRVSCSSCLLLSGDNEPYGFSANAECELQVSEFVVYEACAKFPLPDNVRGFLKVAQKSAFSRSDSHDIQTVCELVSLLLANWKGARGNVIVSDTKTTSEIINSISQDLRTPANSIIGFSSLLSEDNLTSLQSEYVNTIKNNAQNLLLLINDIIDAARIDSGIIKENRSETDLATFVDDIVKIFSGKISHPDLQIKAELDGSLPASVQIDQQRLKYILTTILTNCLKFTELGRISIRVYSTLNNKLSFRISDTGRGFSSEKVKMLFEPSVFESTGKISMSTGLGLTLVKKYIDLLGGSISAESTPGKGTTYNFSVPAEFVVRSASAIESKIEQLPAPQSGNNSVLVIEDDYATSKLLGNYLIKWGYQPRMVNSAEQTMSVIETEKFLAIILDIALPNANGLELLKKIHEHPMTKSTPVIVCSVEADQQKAFMMGAVEYFVKPIKYKFLVEVLQNYRLKKDSNVLCVDDDLPTLNLIKEAIQAAGFTPVAENVSARVMDLIADKNIDLAIVDLDMPYPNGFELIKLIKSNPKFSRLPIIIYTGKENFQEDLKSIDGLFEELLSKRSTNIEDLAQTINDMINRYDTPMTPQEVMSRENVVKIILAEDYKHSQIIVTRLLKKNGFDNVVVVENGLEALENAQKQKFDLILMDMQMPVMSGFEAIEKIRQLTEYKDTPIIALTAFAMKGDREKCLDAGATDYIPKPIDSKEFIEKIRYYTTK